MTAPEKMVLQPCPVYGWDHPDRVKYPVEPAKEYIRADLIPAAQAAPEVAAAEQRVARIAASLFPGGYDANLERINAALRGEGRG